MRLLLDVCVWSGALNALVAGGHDVVWAGELSENPSDSELLARAYSEGRILNQSQGGNYICAEAYVSEGRILVTLDKDFGELAIFREQPHCGIIRLVGARARQ